MEFRKNDLVEVTIEDIGADGEGIGKVEGFTLFVKDALPGDVVRARIVKNKKHYAYARLEKVISPSPFRTEPLCSFHRQCGGCQLQTLSYEKQLEFKYAKIRNNLIRIGGFEGKFLDTVMEPVIGMDYPFHYRNKAQYPVGTDKNGNVITGFYAGRTHDIIANTNCLLGPAVNEKILEIVLHYMKTYKVPAYHEVSGEGLIRHILIRNGFTSGQIMVCLVINKKPKKVSFNISEPANGVTEQNSMIKYQQEVIPGQEYLIRKLCEIEGMTSVSVSFNTNKTNVIMGKEVLCLWGDPYIEDTIHVRDMNKVGYPFTGEELTFHISPLSFYQVNPMQTEKLYSLALEYAGLTGKETVWDLYCGIGTISLFLARKAGSVYGVEVIEQAVLDAQENARRNGIDNAEFYAGRAEEILPAMYRNQGISADVIVVDPPRKGCDSACLETMLNMSPDKIVYVSCDSATLARDLRVLCDGGYEIRKIRGVDMFGNTVHVETVCLLGNRNAKPDTRVKLSVDTEELQRVKNGEKI